MTVPGHFRSVARQENRFANERSQSTADMARRPVVVTNSPKRSSIAYHGLLHQRERHIRCPTRRVPLLAVCGHVAKRPLMGWTLCGYAPFCCPRGHRHYTERWTPLRCQALTQARRIAVTRVASGLA